MEERRYSLPPLPPSVRFLTNEEAEKLNDTAAGQNWPSPKKCQTCGGKKIFRGRVNADEVGIFDCSCEEQWMLHRFYLNAGIPLRFQRLNWLDWEGSVDDMAFVLQWMDHADYSLRAGRGVLLRGAEGAGKSFLASVLARRLMIEQKARCHFIEFPEMVGQLVGSWWSQEEREQYNKIVRNASVLVIDGVGTERQRRERDKDTKVWMENPDHHAAHAFDSIIRHRVVNGLTTIVTTSLDDTEMVRRYGDVAVDSLRQGTTEYVCTTKDFRHNYVARITADERAGIDHPVTIP